MNSTFYLQQESCDIGSVKKLHIAWSNIQQTKTLNVALSLGMLGRPGLSGETFNTNYFPGTKHYLHTVTITPAQIVLCQMSPTAEL